MSQIFQKHQQMWHLPSWGTTNHLIECYSTSWATELKVYLCYHLFSLRFSESTAEVGKFRLGFRLWYWWPCWTSPRLGTFPFPERFAEAGGEAEELEPAELEDSGDEDIPATSEASADTSHIIINKRDQSRDRPRVIWLVFPIIGPGDILSPSRNCPP